MSHEAPVSLDPSARLAERLDPFSADTELASQQWVKDVFRKLGPTGETLRSALHGTWLHEPLHVVMTDVPVGSWTAAVVFDTMGAAGSKSMDKVADACVLLGLAGAVGAAVTGLNDWPEIKERAPRKIGSVHAVLNIAATAVFVASAVARRSKSTRVTGRVLAGLGFMLVSASAHLGGNLIYEHGVGVLKARGVASLDKAEA